MLENICYKAYNTAFFAIHNCQKFGDQWLNGSSNSQIGRPVPVVVLQSIHKYCDGMSVCVFVCLFVCSLKFLYLLLMAMAPSFSRDKLCISGL